MVGTFSVNDCPVTILFDSGASHTFISKECAIRLGLKIENMPNPYNIHSPGGQLITNQIVRRVPLQLQGKGFIAHLIVLPTQRVDIILGMNWMKEQGVLLDTNAHSVHIKPSDHGAMTLSLKNLESTTSTVNHTEGKALADIPVVCEYPDVFSGGSTRDAT